MPADALPPRPARAARTAIVDAWDVGRSWLVVTFGLHLVLAILPAVQVLLVAQLVIELTERASPSWLALIGLAAAVGGGLPLSQCANAAGQRVALRVRTAYQMMSLEYVAGVGPTALARPDVVETAQTAHEAAGAVDSVAVDVIRLASAVLTAATLCATIGSIEPVAGLLVLFSLVPTFAAFTVIARAEERGWPQVGAASRRAMYAAEQLLQQRTGTELAALGSSAQVVAIARTWRERSARVLDGLIAVAMRWELVAGTLTALLLTAALVTLVRGEPSPAVAAAAITGTISGLHAIRGVGYAAGALVTAAPRMTALTACRSQPRRCPLPVVETATSLVVRDVTVRFPGASVPAVEGVSVTAARGEMIAVVGANGAGKTTLVNAILGIVEADGTVEIDGVDLSSTTADQRAARIGLLTQEFGRYEFSVRQSVALGHPDPVPDEAIQHAISLAQAQNVLARLPDGLDTQLGQQWGGMGISGGEWQRLALARLHLRGAGIWILDEPTSAIDAETEEAIFADLHRSRADRITLVISHRAWTLRLMDRIYVMDHGHVVQVGRYSDLVNRPGRFAELFAMQTDETSALP